MNQERPNKEEDATDHPFGEIIYAYTRAQAIDDGVLVDVTPAAREAGFRWPVALTAEVWSLIEAIPEAYNYEDPQGRLWDVLNVARVAIKSNRSDRSEIIFVVILHQANDSRIQLKLHCGLGDQGEPVITIMLPDQD